MISIRKARLDDVDKIVELWKEFMNEHDKAVLRKNPSLKHFIARKKNAAGIFRKFVKKNIVSKYGVIFVAETNDNLIGYSLNLIKDNIIVYKIKKIGYISDLYVKKQYRKKHISSRFKDLAIEWFKNKAINHVSIAVHRENEVAHSIYRKWGFIDYHIDLRREV